MTTAYLKKLIKNFGERAQLRARIEGDNIRLLIIDDYDERWIAVLPVERLQGIMSTDFKRIVEDSGDNNSTPSHTKRSEKYTQKHNG